MFAGTSISLLVGGAAFVRAEFFSHWNRTFTSRMGALLLSHDCLLGLWYVSIIASHPILFNQVVRALTHTSFRLVRPLFQPGNGEGAVIRKSCATFMHRREVPEEFLQQFTSIPAVVARVIND